jgi:hypothetical protein
MRSDGVGIDEPAPPSVIAALKKAGSGPIAAWQAKVSAEAIAILDWVFHGGCHLFLAFLHSRKTAPCQRDADRHDSQNTHFVDSQPAGIQAQPAVESNGSFVNAHTAARTQAWICRF